MAKSTTKKRSTDGENSILSFFNKAPLTPTIKNVNVARHINVKAEPGTGTGTRVTSLRSISGGKGKEKALPLTHGSIGDPVVISDDDEIQLYSPPKQNAAKKRKLSSPPTNVATIMEVDPDKPGPSYSSLPPAFPHCPEFNPPASWPGIVNTGPRVIPLDEDGDPVPPSDEDDFQDQEEDNEDDGQYDDFNGEMEEEVQLEPDFVPDQPIRVEKDDNGEIDLAMDWEEPEDEGMGMEEEDDASVFGDARKSKGSKAKNGGVITACPICAKSMKGKTDKIIQAHINTCLDTPSPSTKRKTRPISSYSFSTTTEPSPTPQPETPTKGPNAFSVLMSGHKEKEQWKDAEADLKRDGKRFIGRRKAPFYKVLTGMPVAVDAFRYGAVPKVTAYLLTHAHSDHYTNLSKSWTHGPIYCSETTANLIIHMLGVEPKWVHGLPDNVPFIMPNTGGVTVTPLEANHCPGSSIFLFEGPQTVNAGDSGFSSPYIGSKRIFRYLHCGDFRACPKMVLHPAIARARIDTCYLDTTYLNPKYCFPPQPQVIQACAALARQTVVGISSTAPSVDDVKPKMNVKLEDGEEVKPHMLEVEEKSKAMMKGWLVKDEVKEELKDVNDEKPKGRTLVVMGTYSIGKERIVKAVAKALGSKIYCDPRKKGILLCQTDPELHDLLSSDPVECQVHLLPLGNIQLDRMQPYLARLHPHFDRILAFRPTGWTYTPPAGTDLLPDVNNVIKRDQARWFSERDLKPMRGSCRTFQMFGVPYSEHSSFFELTCFALSLPGPDLKMIATVNVGNEKSRAKMKKWFEKWLAEKSRRKEKGLPVIVDYRDENYW